MKIVKISQNAQYLQDVPDEQGDQPEFKEEGFEEAKEEVFDKEAFDQAVKEWDIKLKEYEQEHMPNRIASYLITEWNKAMEQAKKDQEKPIAAKGSRIVKTAKKIPEAEDLASYTQALKLYLKNDKVKDVKIQKLIQNLPYPDSIENNFSEEECKLVFESIAYAWKNLTNKDLLEESKIEKSKKGMEGNYWMLNNGILLEGPNHFTIVKQNLNLFATLLDISPFLLHEKISSPPEELIKTILDNGGMRIFVKKDKTAWFQLSDKTYSKWGRNKIKKLNVNKKMVKVIERGNPYKGWKSGILVKL